jgi:endonuclease YncB( thermonuclease family)
VEIDGIEYPVRYIGIDTPEPDAEDPQVQALAEAATAANAALVDGREVVLERDLSDTDQFDRLLRYVWLDDGGEPVLVNRELVLQGFAQASSYPPDVKYEDFFVVAQAAAREGLHGLWAPAPTPTPTPTLAPTPTPEPTPTRASVVISDLVRIDEGERAAFRGEVGTYRWESLSFRADRVAMRWSASATAQGGCRVGWRLEPVNRDDIRSTIRVSAGQQEKGNRRLNTTFSDASVLVSSTCPKWLITLEGLAPPPPPPTRAPSSGTGGSCHPSYRGACLKRGAGDYDCLGGSGNGPNYVAGPVYVVGPDEFRLDGDNDGVGCEG